MLPPANRKPDTVTRLLESGTTGLPQPQRRTEVTDYRAKLQLEAISQPTVGIGADRFGTYAAGGISFVFSDILGDHMIGATVQSTSRIQETGAQAVYLNRKSRWNWGAVVEHLPYVTGGYAQGLAIVDGQQAIVQETRARRRSSTQARARLRSIHSAKCSAPSSPSARAGSALTREVETQLFSPITGELFDEQARGTAAARCDHLGEATAALVYDSSIFGATSPLVGRRYRFEYSQMGGHADVRRRAGGLPPLLHAGAAVHHRGARHCTTAAMAPTREDPRLTPLFIGYQGLVRGYDFGSFDANECNRSISAPAKRSIG